MKKYNLLLDLQRFADDSGSDGAGAGDQGNGSQGQGDNGAGGDPNGGVGDDGKPVTPPAGQITFASQAELDAVINKHVTEAVEKSKQSQQQQKDYDKMNDAEKAQFDLNKAREELAAERLKTKSMANRSHVLSKLGADKLPTGLIGLFDSVLGKDEADVDAAYGSLVKTFNASVQSAVDIRLAGSADKPGGNGAPGHATTAGESSAQQRNEAGKSVLADPWATK